ncbi:L-rhamnose mutarotase [Actinoplanes sp. CA-030573]|uniref:L-rhamnose mutarotase n=1 Tax=Actinoplanes sp. CA-030573 TaxID=3239898 RepID=UPI003D9462ED
MVEVALHTRLRPGKEADYDRLHAAIPADLDTALREAGVHTWRIWRHGLDLFHLVIVDDYSSMRAALRNHPANVRWQAQMTELLEVEDDYSGAISEVKLVWELP